MKKILLSTGNLVYRFSLEEIGSMAREAGIDGLEVVINKRIVELYSQQRENVFRLESIPVLSLHAPYHIIHSWGTLRYELLRTIEIALKTGVEMVVFHPPASPLVQPDFWRFFHSIEDFSKLTDGKVSISVETLSRTFLTKFFCTPERILEWSRRKNLSVTLDCTHISSWNISPLDAFNIYGNSVRSIHLNNTHECHLDDHLPPHKGCIDVAELLRYISQNSIESPIDFVLEINFHLSSKGEIVNLLKESVEFVKFHLSG